MAGLPARVIRRDVESNGLGISAPIAGLLMAKNAGNYFDPGTWGQIGIMRGTIASLASLTGFSARSADILVNFQCTHHADGANPGYATDDFALTDQTSNPSTITSGYKTAVVSGTATWFWWHLRMGNGGGQFSDSIRHSLIGTVGLPGSGSDLEIPDVSIVSGTNYRIRNLKIEFPSLWTY